MASVIDYPILTSKKASGLSRLLRHSSMTPMERARGRFLRAPDHDAGTGGDPAPAADPAVDPVPAADPAADPVGTSLLGDADAAPAADPAADPAPVEGKEPEAAPPEGPPEAYELTAPEGITLDAEAIELATPVFKDLGLNNEQANKLMPVAADFAKRIQGKSQQAVMSEVMAQRAAWADEAQNDPEIGGAKFKETMALSAKALDTLGYPKGSPFRNFLTDSGLGNHPEMIRAMRRIGEAVGEDNNFVRADAGAQTRKSDAEVFYPKLAAGESAS